MITGKKRFDDVLIDLVEFSFDACGRAVLIKEGEPFGQTGRDVGSIPYFGETEEKNIDFFGVAGMNAVAETADDGFEGSAEDIVFFKIDEDTPVIRIEGVVKWFVSAENDGVEEGRAAKSVVDNA